jgi:hypothetical protein
MASQVITGAAVLKLQWSGVTRTWLNVLGLRATGAFPVIDQALANAIHTTVNTSLTASGLLPHLASTTIFERISIRSLNAAAQPEINSTGTPTAGGGTTDPLPLNNAVCVTLRTALAGKSFRGRTYIAGYDEAANDAGGRVLAAANEGARAFLANLNANLAAQGFTLAVLSRATDAVTIPAITRPARTGQVNAVTAVIMRDTKWESQRRRTGRT